MPHRVVFDTNILFSAFGWRGAPYKCVRLAQQNKMVSITCREILEEREDKLFFKREMSLVEAARVVTEITTFSELVSITNELHEIEADPKDDKILECAVIGRATYIISGDRRHLLPLREYKGIPIVRAADFLEREFPGELQETEPT